MHKQKQPECGASALCTRLLFLAKLLVGQQWRKTESHSHHTARTCRSTDLKQLAQGQATC